MNHSREREVLIVGCDDGCGDGVIEQRKSGRVYHRLVAGQLFNNLRLDEQLFLTETDVGRHGVYFLFFVRGVSWAASIKQTWWINKHGGLRDGHVKGDKVPYPHHEISEAQDPIVQGVGHIVHKSHHKASSSDPGRNHRGPT